MLPMNATPVYTITVPSTKTPFKFRPFLVKDEKALLVAQQSEDATVMLDTIKEVIKSCAKTDIDVEKLASFDIEYIFLQLRAKSVGETIELIFQCDEDHGVDNEKARSMVTVDLNAVAVTEPEGHTKKISLFGDVGIALKYPTIETLKKLEQANGDDINYIFDIVVDCIDYVYTSEEVFPAREQKKEELLQFLENLTSEQFNNVQQFFRTMPALRVDVAYTCPVCGKQHNKYLEGLESFF